jgi:hypothetical protein
MSQAYNFTSRRNNLALLLALFITIWTLAACGDTTPAVSPQQPAGEAMQDKAPISDDAMTEKEEMAGDAMSNDDAMAEKEEMAGEDAQDDAAMAGKEEMAGETMSGGEAMELPLWFETELTNVNTGETFKITDFRDKVVLVETMAVWCSNCLRQQQEVQALHGLLGDQPDLVSVALDIDLNETPDILKAHTDKNGFDWVYAVAPAEVARDISQLYGGQFLNPPATPMLIIDRHGQAHPLPFGHKSAPSLQEALAPFLSEAGG